MLQTNKDKEKDYIYPLNGIKNKLIIISDNHSSEDPYVLEAPGAGLDKTARNIRRDLLYKLNGREIRKL